MANITEEKQQKEAQSKIRPYHSPRLSVYGAVSDLTEGGSTMRREGEKGIAIKKRT